MNTVELLVAARKEMLKLPQWKIDAHRNIREGYFGPPRMSKKDHQADLPGRYAAFAYDCYYPGGAMSDCVGTFPTEALAREWLRTHFANADNVEVHDLLKSVSKHRRYRPHQWDAVANRTVPEEWEEVE